MWASNDLQVSALLGGALRGGAGRAAASGSASAAGSAGGGGAGAASVSKSRHLLARPGSPGQRTAGGSRAGEGGEAGRRADKAAATAFPSSSSDALAALLDGRGDLLALAPPSPICRVAARGSSGGEPGGPSGLRHAVAGLPTPPRSGAPAELAAYYDAVRGLCAPAIAARLRADMARVAADLRQPA